MIYIYPGTFSPPTWGHMHIVEKAYELIKDARYPITIICSVNPDKGRNWFTPEESKELWQSYMAKINDAVVAEWDKKHYEEIAAGDSPVYCPPTLPIRVETLEEFLKKRKSKSSNLIMIRGIRGESDLEEEKKVVLYNKKHFGISNFLYICADQEYCGISSSYVREFVSQGKFAQVQKMVSKEVFLALLEKLETIIR